MILTCYWCIEKIHGKRDSKSCDLILLRNRKFSRLSIFQHFLQTEKWTNHSFWSIFVQNFIHISTFLIFLRFCLFFLYYYVIYRNYFLAPFDFFLFFWFFFLFVSFFFDILRKFFSILKNSKKKSWIFPENSYNRNTNFVKQAFDKTRVNLFGKILAKKYKINEIEPLLFSMVVFPNSNARK